MSETINVVVIIGSTRGGRLGEKVARWFAGELEATPEVEVDLMDLAGLTLPPNLEREAGDDVDVFRKRVESADAFVVVTPEYNHSFPAPLKTAIDWLDKEWHAKPVAFVSYGGVSGGLRAVEQLRQIFAELHAPTVRETVSFHGAHRHFDTQGRLVDPGHADRTTGLMIKRLLWWAKALKAARSNEPYAA